jgi:hypothetical protein
MPFDQPVAPISQSLAYISIKRIGAPEYPLPHLAVMPLPFLDTHEFASISAHFARISWFFAFAASRFALVRSSLWARRHLFTSVLAPLHMPIAFHMNPFAWHLSRMFITSSQAVAN